MAQDPTLPLDEFVQLLEPGQRLFGLDLGSKTIGVAVSDLTRSIATPVDTIRRKKFKEDAVILLDLVQEYEIAGIIIGYPINLDGSTGPRVQATEAFARNLAQVTDLPLAYWDERLSTVAVERTLLEADVSRKKRAEVIDKMAAAFILQGFLDYLRSKG